jgi:hypothetical protein
MSYSADFPVTAGAADSTLSGAEDAFIVKLDPPGSHLNYATFLGGFYGEIDLRIAVDSSGRAYVGGGTSSPDFPATPGAYDTSPNGVDAFIAKLNPAGSSFEYATLLGGSGWETFGDIQVDRKGYAYITGLTNSPDFPTSSRAFASTYAGGEDGFVARLVPSGAQLAYASFLGSTAYDQLSSVAVEQPGTVFISGYTRGQDFPIAVGAYDPHHNGGFDIIVARLLLQ